MSHDLSAADAVRQHLERVPTTGDYGTRNRAYARWWGELFVLIDGLDESTWSELATEVEVALMANGRESHLNHRHVPPGNYDESQAADYPAELRALRHRFLRGDRPLWAPLCKELFATFAPVTPNDAQPTEVPWLDDHGVYMHLAPNHELHRLDIYCTRDAAGLRSAASLVHDPSLRGLYALTIDWRNLSGDRSRADDDRVDIARGLANNPALASLRELDLTDFGLGLEGMRALCGGTRKWAITHLLLGGGECERGNDLDAACLEVLAGSAILDEVVVLDLSWNESLDTTALMTLLASPRLEKLETLDLSITSIGEAGIEHLLQWRGLRKLTRLNLVGCGASDEALDALHDHPSLADCCVET